MIDLSINSRIYKILEKFYNMLKLNLYISIFSLTILGIGGSIAAGFYCYNNYFKKNHDINFNIFYKNFKHNFQKGLFFTAIPIFLVFLLFVNGKSFLFITFFKILVFIIIFMLLFYSLILLFLVGLVNMTIKNYLIYGALIFIKKVAYLILVSLLVIFVLKHMFMKNIAIFLLLEWVILIAILHKLLINNIYIDFKN